MEPRYIHDCDACIFLGQYKKYDLYFCGKGSLVSTTVILRYSDEGGDYHSGLTFTVTSGEEAYQEALVRALRLPEPEHKQKIIDYFDTFGLRSFPERQERFAELLLIAETDPKNYPTLIGSLKYTNYIENYLRENNDASIN